MAPVIRRDGGATGTIIQQPDALEFSRGSFAEGSHLIHVAYGDVSDQVTLRIVDTPNTAPTATSTSPTIPIVTGNVSFEIRLVATDPEGLGDADVVTVTVIGPPSRNVPGTPGAPGVPGGDGPLRMARVGAPQARSPGSHDR